MRNMSMKFKRFFSATICAIMIMAIIPSNLIVAKDIVRGASVEVLADNLEQGLLGEFFRTTAYRDDINMPMHLFTFDDKTGESIIPTLSGNENWRNYFDRFNGSGDFATARFSGRIDVPEDSEYTFYGFGDDGFRIWIDGELIIDFWQPEWEKEQESEPISLEQGLHDIKVEYLQGWGGAMLKLDWSSAQISKQVIPAEVFFQPATREDLGLSAQYYICEENAHISSFKLDEQTDTDSVSNLDGSDLRPILAQYNGRADYGAIIYHGYLVPSKTEDYTFYISGDDGYRFWLDDELLIDSWQANSQGEKTTASVRLVEGKLYPLKVRYAQVTDDANIKLSWSSDSLEKEVIDGQNLRIATSYDIGDSAPQGLLAEVYKGTYLEEKTGEKIIPELKRDYAWLNFFREFNGSQEYGSARFTGQLRVDETKDYTFYMIGDDGFRLWINDELVIDFWKSEWDVLQTSDPIRLNAGMNDIKVEYFQGFGGAYIDLAWSSDDFAKETILQERLYPGDSAQGIISEYFKCEESNDPDDYKFTNKTGENIESQLNIGGNELSEILMLSNATTDNALVRWNASLKAKTAGEYSFSMESEGGYRVYLDGKLIIDNWVISSESSEKTSGLISLSDSKRHNLVVELLKTTGETGAKLYWQVPGGQKELVPATALYASDRIWFDKVVSKNALLPSLIGATKLYDNTQTGANVGQASQEAKDEFALVIENATTVWKDFDASAETQEEEKITLDDAIKKFKFLTVQSTEGSGLTEFNNALYQGQDPFITYNDGYYYLVSSSNDPDHGRMYMSKSKSLLDQGERVQIFDFRGVQNRIFAPELFFIEGKWYIYYCADVGVSGYGWKHQACVLESVTDDPQGEWIDRGVLYTGENGVNRQANDFTVFEYNEQLYACWGSLGEPAKPDGGHYGPAIVKMDSPIKISDDRSWLPGYGGEGPRAIQRDGKLFMTVSQGDFKSSGYRLGLYSYDETKGDILDENSWTFSDNAFHGNAGVYGPGRASFFKSIDDEDWMAFHSKVYPANSNAWRQVSLKKVEWNENGSPNFGTPTSPHDFVALPLGDPGIGLAYQAEAATTLGLATKEYQSKGFQGSGYVKIGDQNGDGVTFNVDAPTAGDYFVRVRYANGVKVAGEWEEGVSDKTPIRGTLGLIVNDERVTTALFDKTETDWQHWMYACARVALKAGENSIVYKKESSDSGNIQIDYIAVDSAHDAVAPALEKSFTELEALIAKASALEEENVLNTDLWNALQYGLESSRRMNASSPVKAVTGRWIALDTAINEINEVDLSVDDDYSIYLTHKPNEDSDVFDPKFGIKNISENLKEVIVYFVAYDVKGRMVGVEQETLEIEPSQIMSTDLSLQLDETVVKCKFIIADSNFSPLTMKTSFDDVAK